MSRRLAKSEQLGGENQSYGTPEWCVHRLLERQLLPRGQWLEPCAGAGSLVQACHSFVTKDWMSWDMCDIDPVLVDHLRRLQGNVYIGDCVDWMGALYPKSYDVGITNPPFELAEDIVLGMLRTCWWVVILQRLSWLGTAMRASWFQEHQCFPDRIWLIPERPSFRDNEKGKRQTDNSEYAWFVWEPARDQKGIVRLLARTPREERISSEQEMKELYQMIEDNHG